MATFRLVFAVSATLLVCVCGGLTRASSANRQHATEELSGDQFDTFMSENPVTAVLFYTPWSFYSQQLMPQWDLAGQKLELHDPPVPIARVNAQKNEALAKKYEIQAFPTIKLFVNGTVVDYDRQQIRSWQQIVKWVSHHLDCDHILKSADDVDPYLHDNDLNVVGLYPDGADSSTFGKLAQHFEGMIFAEARGSKLSAEVAKHLVRHSALSCETVDVGTSNDNTKVVQLSRTGMDCSNTPRNPQRPEWGDSYGVSVSGQELTVQRLDSSDGWRQLLQMKCCDTADSTSKGAVTDIPVPSIVMFMPHDEGFARYDGDMDDMDSLKKWISARHWPMVMRFNEDTVGKILDDSRPKRPPLLLISASQDPGPLGDVMTEAARMLRGSVQVTLSGAQSGMEKRLMELTGVDEAELPAIMLLDGEGSAGDYKIQKKYRLPVKENLNAGDVVRFVRSFESGSLKPSVKSEVEPADGPNSEVPGVLVGSTFTEYAHDEKVDVLVNFYAPWCGHCKKFEPDYRKLAMKLAHVPSLRVMKLDATRNEVPGMNIMGFPTLALFPAGKSPKKAILYEGHRDESDMLWFLHSNCGIQFNETAPAVVAVDQEPVSGLLDLREEDL
jgi:protein disulfide-isomerase-like protein